jgi:hypothetical protein
MVAGLALVLAVAEPPLVAVEPGEPDWEVGRERVVVALTDAGIEPVAAGARRYRPLATVRATCRDDAFAVEVRLREVDGRTYRVERATGHGCGSEAQADAVGAWVVAELKASCRERPCVPRRVEPTPRMPNSRVPVVASKWSLRGGVGALAAPGRSFLAAGVAGLGVARAFGDRFALDLEVLGSAVPARDRNGAIGFGIARAHAMLHGGRCVRLGVGVGGGTVVGWAVYDHAAPRLVGGDEGSRRFAATGLLSAVARATIPLDAGWALYANSGLGLAGASARLASTRYRPVPLLDTTIGLQWTPSVRSR